MKNYRFTAVDSQGKNVHQIVNSETKEEAVTLIKARSLYLLTIEEEHYNGPSLNKLRVKSLVIFCRQLGTMLTAGIPIMNSLEMLQGKADSNTSRNIYRNIYEDVQKGNSLSASMTKQKGVFPDLLLNMVLAGELGGTLDVSLTRMAGHFEKEAKLKNKIRSASIYPAILGVVSVSVVLLLVMFVLPTLTAMFDKTSMPWSTKIILAFSHFMIKYWFVLLILLILAYVAFRLAMQNRSFKIQAHKLLLFLPIIGKLNQTIYSARAARAFASLYSSGVQTMDMIETTGKVLGNAYLESLFEQVIYSVSRGEYISKAIEETEAFDPMLSSMIYIGEQSGSLGDILNNTADYFDNEADSAIARMLALIEPIMLVILGIVIGFIVVSIIQPIFQMYNSVGA